MEAKVTKAFKGVPDGKLHSEKHEPGDIIKGDLARVAIEEGWAKPTNASKVEADAEAKLKAKEKADQDAAAKKKADEDAAKANTGRVAVMALLDGFQGNIKKGTAGLSDADLALVAEVEQADGGKKRPWVLKLAADEAAKRAPKA